MSEKDEYAGFPRSPMRFGRRGVQVSPSDSADLAEAAKTIVVLADGNVSVIPVNNADDAPMNFVGLAVGSVIPFEVRRVRTTGTTATVAAIYD